MTPGPSRHITWAEVACHDQARTPYPLDWRKSRGVPLAAEFEVVRNLCGDRPIVVLSGYRTPAWNRHVGGARHSQHLEGCALDLRPPTGMTVAAFHALILAYAQTEGSAVGGLGLYTTFVHIDIRPSTRLVRWTGGRPAAEVISR